MSTEFVAVPVTDTVGETLRHIREVERTRETVYALHFLDPKNRALLCVVTLHQRIAGEPDQPIDP